MYLIVYIYIYIYNLLYGINTHTPVSIVFNYLQIDCMESTISYILLSIQFSLADFANLQF